MFPDHPYRIVRRIDVAKSGPKMTHIQFYRVCQALVALAIRLCREQPTPEKACELLSKKTGLEVVPFTLAKAQEATGVYWMGEQQKAAAQRDSELAVIAACLLELWRLCLNPVPPQLTEVVRSQIGDMDPADYLARWTLPAVPLSEEAPAKVPLA